MILRTFLSILVCVAVASSGCQRRAIRKESPGGAVRVDHPYPQARLNEVGFLQQDLSKRIAVEQTGAQRTATNTLNVYAVLRNRTQEPQRLLARTQYFDADGVPAEGPDAWKHIYMEPLSTQTYRTLSGGTTHEYYYIEIQEMR